MKRLKTNRHILYVLKTCDPKLRKAILKYAEPETIKTINDIVYNTLTGNHKLNPQTRNTLKTYKKDMRQLCCSKKSITSKRKLLIQRGGFLPTLITSVLAGIIGKLIENV